MRTEQIRPLLIAILLLLVGTTQSVAQSAFSLVEHDPTFAAGNYGAYSDRHLPHLTPAPKGYQPFYISHYGRHGSRYMIDKKGYMEPYKTLLKADSLGKLTALGKMALREIRLNIDDADNRWGDLTELGKQQQQGIAHRMLQNFPEVFDDGAFVDIRSTLVTRSALAMGAIALQLVKERPQLEVSMHNSYSDLWYMNHQNKALRDKATTRRSQKALNAFINSHWRHGRLTTQLFNDTAYVSQHVDVKWFYYYLIKAMHNRQNTELRHLPNPLLHLFTTEDLYLFWRVENVWNYINSGFCPLNDAKQPYVQLDLLRKIVQDADRVIIKRQHGASLRVGHETVLLPIVCLMGVNGYDLRTDDFDALETHGWWAGWVIPMAGNLQIVFYHKSANDRNPLVKVLLNEREATLPLSSDIAPYYRWSDVRSFFLRRIAEGESALGFKR